MKMRFLLVSVLFPVSLLLTGCSDRLRFDTTSHKDAQEVLESLDGPKVDGIEGELFKSAQDAALANNFKRAGQIYKQLLDKAPDNAWYLQGYAESARRGGAYEESIIYYDKLLAKDANNASAMEGKALSLIGKGDMNEAGKLLNKVMLIDDKRWRTLNAIGILFTTRRMVDEAVAYYNEALRLSPDNASILNNVGLSLASDKQFDKAQASLERASALVKDKSDERRKIDLNRSLVYGLSGNMDQAQMIAAQYLDKPQLYNNMGLYAHLAEHDDLAKSYLDMALTSSPTYYGKAWENMSLLSGQPKAGVDPEIKKIKKKSGMPAETKPALAPKVELKKPEKQKESAPVVKAAAPKAEAPKEESPAPQAEPAVPAAPASADTAAPKAN